MDFMRFAMASVLGLSSGVLCADSTVIPIPEADQQYSSPTPVDAIVVDKNGDMTQTQYTYDPGQGGVVINNYNIVEGPDASVYFPVFAVGFIWWGGYWVDHNGYYWNGYGYRYVNNHGWHNHWNNYWHNNWNHKWNNYRQQHPHAGGHNNRENFDHHHGMNRPSHPSHQGGGSHGGSHGGGHGGGRR